MPIRRPIRWISATHAAVIALFGSTAFAAEPLLEEPITAEDRSHWAFQSPTRPTVPSVKAKAWTRTPVDRFILAALESKGITPAPEADRLTLLRRLSYDLIGLPPTPEDQDRFLADDRPDAYEQLVERLLASPHYGERWGQHWLDVVRYGESNGYEADGDRPHAWRYRDYVVQSFNSDKSYARFLTEQLAGDELAVGQDPRAAAELLIAAGMHRCGPVHVVGGNTDPEVNRQELLTEMVNGAVGAFLGLTIACARCHDHKFDPISQADYYRFQAFFAAAQYSDIDISTSEERAEHQRQTAAIQAKIKPLQAQVAALEAPYRKALADKKKAALEEKYRAAIDIPAEQRTAEQKLLAANAQSLLKISWDEVVAALPMSEREKRLAWKHQIADWEAHLPPPPARAWTLTDLPNPAPTYLLKRGDVKKRGRALEPAFVRIVAMDEKPGPKRLTRRDLADWLTRPDHPLTARVMVNRLWQHHFGRGLVETPNDFGIRGAKPSHPELLDWLAVEFVHSGWSMKALHRMLVCSSVYRQSSQVEPSDAVRRIDSENRLLWRMNRVRLEAEVIRDAFLAVAGTWNRKLGGPMIRVPLEPEIYDLIFTEGEPIGLWKVNPDPREHLRRTIYLMAKRNVRQPLLEAFDQPDLLASCPTRPVSTFAPQALILMNGPLAQQQSRAFADRLRKLGVNDPKSTIAAAYRIALGRLPRPEELALVKEFLSDQSDLLRRQGRREDAEISALTDFCLALMNSNEFIHVR